VASWDDVARIVGELPETTEASPRDWRVRKKLMVWERSRTGRDCSVGSERETASPPLGDGNGPGVRAGVESVEPLIHPHTARFERFDDVSEIAGVLHNSDGPSVNTSESSSTRKRPQTQCW
jgi:hypothetical protein